MSSTPQLPFGRANDEVNKSLLKAIRFAHVEGRNWREELNKFLMAYRFTPHTTGKSTAELLFRRALKITLPEVTYLVVNKRPWTTMPKENREIRITLKRNCAKEHDVEEHEHDVDEHDVEEGYMWKREIKERTKTVTRI